MGRRNRLPHVAPASLFYFVIEKFKNGDAQSVRDRFLSKGRMMPEASSIWNIARGRGGVRSKRCRTISSVLAKLNVGNRAHAVVQAFRRGVISLDEME